jgi:tetratricopeptide (TPR) repeat protein
MSRFLLICLIALLAAPAARAYNFEVTEAEWASWPPYCKARYATVRVGKSSEYGRRMSSAEIEQWHATMGDGAWYGLHHFCAGLAYADRAKMDAKGDKREFNVNRALTEYGYMLRNTPTTDRMYAEVLTRVGLVHREKGDLGAAQRYFSQAIENNPSYAGGYLAQYQILQGRGEASEAREVLRKADQATGGQSSEVKYFLGMVSLDLGDIPAATAYAREAYALGYPLPALRNRLAKSGVSL